MTALRSLACVSDGQRERILGTRDRHRNGTAALLERARQSAVAPAVAGWSVAYLLACLTGQRFNASYLRFGWQLIPYDTLRDAPITSVWYLHTQPPLWNLLVGSVGRWSPFPVAFSLQLVMAAAGAGLAGACAALARSLSLSRWVAVAVALAVTVNSDVLRLAFTPQYELPVAFALAAMIAIAIGSRGASWSCVGVIAVATVVVLTRSLYHPVWLAVTIATVLWWFRRSIDRRTVAACIVVPLVLVGGWMVKNDVLFGTATTSSWTGMNLLRSVQPIVPRADLQQLYAEGDISGVALAGPFLPYETYEPFVEPCTPSHTNPAVGAPTYPSTDLFGQPAPATNLNFECLIPVYDVAGDDALAIIRHEPGAWLDGRLWSAQAWFATPAEPTSADSTVVRALDASESVTRLQVPWSLSMRDWGSPFFGLDHLDTHLSLASLLAEICLVVVVVNRLRWFRRSTRRDRRITFALVLALATLLWTLATGVVGELGEQQRFREMVEPLVMTLAVAFVVRGAARHSRHGPILRDIAPAPSADVDPSEPAAAGL
jgi:hypothetical protein